MRRRKKGFYDKEQPICSRSTSSRLPPRRQAAARSKVAIFSPPESILRERLKKAMDPLPFWYALCEDCERKDAFPLPPRDQRPMAM